MFRRTFLTLCILAWAATALAWAVSYRNHPLYITMDTDWRVLEIGCVRGRAQVCYVVSPPRLRETDPVAWSASVHSALDSKRRAGLLPGPAFHYRHYPAGSPTAVLAMTLFGFPLWAAFTLFAAWPVSAAVHGPLHRHRRRKRGLCVRCGYNLKENTTGRCPECGEAM